MVHIGLLLPIYVIIPALFKDFATAVAQLLDNIRNAHSLGNP